MRPLFALPLLLAFATSQTPAEENAVEAPPALPEEDVYTQAEEGGDTQVTIRKRGSAVVEEYRHNGRLYMVKITPSKGLPYYLMDSDGDGSLETRRNSLDDPEVVKWRIFSW